VHSELLPFVGAAILIALTPGADTRARRAQRAGRRGDAGPPDRAGHDHRAARVGRGVGLWGRRVLNASAEVFTAVKLAGALYLLWLGLQAIRHAGAHEASGRARSGSPFRQGLLCNLLNPKAGIFFTALLPQFVSPDDPALLVSLLMTAIAAAASLAWLSLYATVVPRAGDVLRRPPVRRALDRATGVVLIGLGVRLALTRR
jgi:threonine/homoserine/homoserine lactone efflux protein